MAAPSRRPTCTCTFPNCSEKPAERAATTALSRLYKNLGSQNRGMVPCVCAAAYALVSAAVSIDFGEGQRGRGEAPKDSALQVDEVVRHGGIVEGVNGWRDRVVPAVDDHEVTRRVREECRIVDRPARQPVLHHSPEVPVDTAACVDKSRQLRANTVCGRAPPECGPRSQMHAIMEHSGQGTDRQRLLRSAWSPRPTSGSSCGVRTTMLLGRHLSVTNAVQRRCAHWSSAILRLSAVVCSPKNVERAFGWPVQNVLSSMLSYSVCICTAGTGARKAG